MKIFAKSDVGKAREMNQDYFFISNPEDDIKLFILADGMGGYNGGEVASNLATQAAKSYILNNFNKIEHSKESILKLIKNAVEYANMIVYEKSKKDKELEGMGTTIEVCLIYNNKVYIGHVGDSRVYRLRKEFFRKLTKDHSYVEQLIEDKKNMLTKALGCTAFVEPDCLVKGFLKGDILLISSDGLTNMIKDEEIYNIIKNNPEKAVDELVEKANQNGGYDNITVIIIL